MSLYRFVPQAIQSLQNLDRFLDKSVAFATTRKFEPNTLLSARLAPDQYPLLRQIQSTCDAAKSLAARLAGKEPPKHPDTETTIDELRARIKTVVDYLGTFSEKDFAGAEERAIELPFLPGKVLRGDDYFFQMALPNFYFHYTTAYAILRHNGVDLGKMDFVGGMTMKDKA